MCQMSEGSFNVPSQQYGMQGGRPPTLAEVSMNMMFSCLALSSPSSVETCLQKILA